MEHLPKEDKCSVRAPHVCSHCSTPLAVTQAAPRSLTRLRFTQTVPKARHAASQGCPVFQDLLDIYTHRKRSAVIKAHLLRACSCCLTFYQRLQHVLMSLSTRPFQLTLQTIPYGPDENNTVYAGAHLDCGTGRTEDLMNAYTYKGDNAAKMLPAFDREVCNEDTIDAIRHWLADCTCLRAIATEAGNTRYKPRRLIDIGTKGQCDKVTVTGNPEHAAPAYVCLSYCWGGPQTTVLSKCNMNGPTGSWTVPKQLIPSAFEDAFTVTRLLGYRYIWIDSLCIIQDDEEDLDHEILQMPQIFKGADLTICASTSQNCGQGFLHTRLDYSERKVHLNLPGGQKGQLHLDDYLWWDAPVPEPLSTRAWAYQERLLSPRLLEFGWRTSRWTCACRSRYSGHSELAVEQRCNSARRGPRRRRDYNLYAFMNPPGLRHFPVSTEDLFSAWCTIVRTYSALALTFADDRLAAIGGIAAELHRVTGVKYLAGLWLHERLPSLLQWRVMETVHELRKRPGKVRAPSWSWAAIDDRLAIFRSEFEIAGFEILAVNVEGGFGREASGSIKMRGPVRTGLRLRGMEVQQAESSEGLEITGTAQEELIIFPDCYGEIFTSAENGLVITDEKLTFIAVGRAHSNQRIVRGLVLSEIEAEKSLYKRLGMFQVVERGSFVMTDWDVMVLTVV